MIVALAGTGATYLVLPIFLPVLVCAAPYAAVEQRYATAGSAARTGATSTGMPFSTALPEGTSTA